MCIAICFKLKWVFFLEFVSATVINVDRDYHACRSTPFLSEWIIPKLLLLIWIKALDLASTGDKFLQSKTYRLYIRAENHCPKYTVQVIDGMPPIPNWNPSVFTHKTVRKSNTFYLTIVFSVLFDQNKVIEWKWTLLLFTSGSPWTTRATRNTWTPWATRSLGSLRCKFLKSQTVPLLNDRRVLDGTQHGWTWGWRGG